MDAQLGDDKFPSQISTLLSQGDTVQVLGLFTSKNHSEVHSNAWDLIPIVSSYLTEDCLYNNSEVFKCCRKIITFIAECSKAEEVLLQFIEEIELAGDDTKFVTLLKPVQTVLLRVPDKRITSLGWCLNAIKHYLSKIEIFEDFNLAGEERLLLDADETVVRINNLYDHLLSFCENFLDEWDDGGVAYERVHAVSKFLVELLGKPLACSEFGVLNGVKLRGRMAAEILVEKFFSVKTDPFLYLEMRDCDDSSELIKPNDLSLGVFYYLILSEEVCNEHIPKIYNPVYIFHNCLSLVNNLLTQQNQFLLEKGVHLAAALLKNVDHEELPYLLLDSQNHYKFCQAISTIIVYNENVEIRKKSLQILQKYLWSFEHQGRYLIIINLMPMLNHSGLKGNIVIQYKEMLTEQIKRGNLNELSKYYKEHKLFDLLDEFTSLKNDEETDLVDNSDQIVSTLNFLRFLVLVDKAGETGIDCYLETLEEGFFKHLKTGIALAKEHYRLKLKELDEEKRTRKEKSDCRVSLKVSGRNLLEMSAEQKIQVLNMSLTTLDVIDSLLNRVLECMNRANADL